jgi:hypothetical protein
MATRYSGRPRNKSGNSRRRNVCEDQGRPESNDGRFPRGARCRSAGRSVNAIVGRDQGLLANVPEHFLNLLILTSLIIGPRA